MRIVFFGTPAFAVPSLVALAEAGADLCAVVTQPDRPRGRSRSAVLPPPVKEAALARGLTVLQPDRPTGDLFLATLRRLEPELGVVVAYGHLLRPDLLALPRRGMVNVHASLLPAWRGAAPIPRAILAGDRLTGITIMEMDAGLDSGPILLQRQEPIRPDDTAGTLTPRLATLGAAALLEALELMRTGELRSTPQEHARATHAPKIHRDLARVNWTEEADAVSRRIRAFDPVPGAWTTAAAADLKLYGAREVPGSGAPGEILATAPDLLVATGGGAVAIAEVQPAGRRRMAAAEWARGHGATVGKRLE